MTNRFVTAGLMLMLASAGAAAQPASSPPAPAPLPTPPADAVPEDAATEDAGENTPGENDEPALPLPPSPAPLDSLPNSSPAGSPNPVPAAPALNRSRSPQPQGGFRVRLARAPKMMGDFFGRSFSPVAGQMLVGEAVHHVASAPTGTNNFRLITSGNSGTIFAPGGVLDPVVAPPAPAKVTGLSVSSADPPFDVVAIDTGDSVTVFLNDGDTTPELDNVPLYEVFEQIEATLPFSGPGDLIGRTRMQDNNSAMPQDRVYFDYSYFHNAALTAGGVDVNRFAPGLEKTFLGGMASVEVRAPFGATLNSTLVSGAAADTSNLELGNLVVAPKLLLSSDRDLAVAVGLGVTLPTGDDLLLNMPSGAAALRVNNDAVHLLPYLAMLYAPCGSDFFGHLFLTYDFDTGGNGVDANVTGSGLESIGTWSDQHLVTLNLAAGRYLYRATRRSDRLQMAAVSAELHYTGSISGADSVEGGGFVVGDPAANLSLLNATVGGHARLGMTTFSAGYALPLTSDDRVFDGELRLFVNRAF